MYTNQIELIGTITCISTETRRQTVTTMLKLRVARDMSRQYRRAVTEYNRKKDSTEKPIRMESTFFTFDLICESPRQIVRRGLPLFNVGDRVSVMCTAASTRERSMQGDRYFYRTELTVRSIEPCKAAVPSYEGFAVEASFGRSLKDKNLVTLFSTVRSVQNVKGAVLAQLETQDQGYVGCTFAGAELAKAERLRPGDSVVVEGHMESFAMRDSFRETAQRIVVEHFDIMRKVETDRIVELETDQQE